MRVAIIALLITAIVCQAPTPTPAVNTLDTCLRQVKASMHEASVATQFGLSKNYLDMAKDLLETGADAIQSYEDCRQVDISAVVAWISVNTSTATQTCIEEMIWLYGFLRAAVADMKAHASSTKILADWSTVSQSLDRAAQGCIPN
jgi:hypothetical protein